MGAHEDAKDHQVRTYTVVRLAFTSVAVIGIALRRDMGTVWP